MGGEAGTKAVNTTALFKPCSVLRRAEDVPRFSSAQGAVLGSVGEKPDRRPVAFPILTQLHEQVLRKDSIAVLATFALLYTKGHARSIDVCDLEVMGSRMDARTGIEE
jgi:hypothetical protein